MSDGSRLIKTIQEAAKPAAQDIAGIVIGTVTSDDPLTITVGDKLELTEDFLILSPLVVKTIVNVYEPGALDSGHIHTFPPVNSPPWETSDAIAKQSDQQGSITPHYHVVPGNSTETSLKVAKIWDGLSRGDTVFMLRVDNGQKYYVLQKLGGVGI